MQPFEPASERPASNEPIREGARHGVHAASPPRHPLAPLHPEEMQRVVALITADPRIPALIRFVYVTLEEPPKEQVLGPAGAGDLERLALAVVYDRTQRLPLEVVVSLSLDTVRSVTPRPGMHPAILREEFQADAAAVKDDARWQAAMQRRGIRDFDLVEVHPWPAGNPGLAVDLEQRRIARAVTTMREHCVDNPFTRPIEGVVAVVDRDTHEVVEVLDEEVVPIPPYEGRYDALATGPAREDLRGLHIVQPQGPSFTVDDHEIHWQRWSFRISLHPLEALVLHAVTYRDGDKERSVCYRAGLSEMVVPYGDPAPAHWWMAAFDAGEVMIGALANSLALGCDCLGEIRYVDAPFVQADGSVTITRQAICIHEEDYGILWKHTDHGSGTTEVRRSRRLVVSCIATVGNYEYGFFWYFYQDGTIQMEVKLTGIMQFKALSPGVEDPFSPTVAPGLGAPNHQHFFNFRLDMDVDGTANCVYEVEAEPIATGPENPWGNAFRVRQTLLASESGAQRDVDFARGRYWVVVNESVRNAHGGPVGYKLVPGTTTGLLVQPDCSVAKRAAFANHALWVTPYSPDERHAAGDYPNQHPGGDGLPRWTKTDRRTADTDIVLWYSFGTLHLPRPEDWPVMPVEYAGFSLKPVGFFSTNPALDVAPSAACPVALPVDDAGDGCCRC